MTTKKHPRITPEKRIEEWFRLPIEKRIIGCTARSITLDAEIPAGGDSDIKTWIVRYATISRNELIAKRYPRRKRK